MEIHFGGTQLGLFLPRDTLPHSLFDVGGCLWPHPSRQVRTREVSEKGEGPWGSASPQPTRHGASAGSFLSPISTHAPSKSWLAEAPATHCSADSRALSGCPGWAGSVGCKTSTDTAGCRNAWFGLASESSPAASPAACKRGTELPAVHQRGRGGVRQRHQAQGLILTAPSHIWQSFRLSYYKPNFTDMFRS